MSFSSKNFIGVMKECLKMMIVHVNMIAKAQQKLRLQIRKVQRRKKYLDMYGTNLTDKVKEGKIDRVIGRDNEIERVIQILNRRTKNNPVLNRRTRSW